MATVRRPWMLWSVPMEGRYFDVDESQWPMVVFRFRGEPTDEDFEAYLRAMESLYERGERFAILFDARGTVQLSAKHRRRQAQWLKDNAERIRRFNVGSAFVIDSAFVRGLLTAIFWIQPMPSPHTVTETLAEAEAWCRARLG